MTVVMLLSNTVLCAERLITQQVLLSVSRFLCLYVSLSSCLFVFLVVVCPTGFSRFTLIFILHLLQCYKIYVGRMPFLPCNQILSEV